jgi:hypothetical protein
MADKVLSPIAGVVSGVLGGGKPKETPAPPPPAAPATMPDPEMDDAAVKAAKKRKLTEVAARSGRASTILSDETLGG